MPLPTTTASRRPVAMSPKDRKDEPYVSAKDLRIEQVELNGQVANPDNGREIVCRHLATMYLHRFLHGDTALKKDAARGLNAKPAILQSYCRDKPTGAEDMQAYYERKIGNPWKKSMRHDTNELGAYLFARFCSLGPGEKAGFLLHTELHAMAIALERKDREGEGPPRYVIHFYDPKHTNRAVRQELGGPDLDALTTCCLENYLLDREELGKYLGRNPYLTLIDFDGESDPQAADGAALPTGSMLTPAYAEQDLTEGLVFHLSYFGDSGGLRFVLQSALKDVLQGGGSDYAAPTLPEVESGQTISVKALDIKPAQSMGWTPEKLMLLLSQTSESGLPALNIAVHEGHTDAVLALCEAIGTLADRLVPEQLADLVAGADDGTPVLSLAAELGRAGIVAALGRLIERSACRLTRLQLIDLLAGKNKVGMPALWMAMYGGSPEVTAALCGLIMQFADSLEQEQLVQLLAGRSRSAMPALSTGMGANRGAAVTALCVSIEEAARAGRLKESSVFELMAGRRKDGSQALALAAERGCADALVALLGAFERLAQAGYLTQQQLVELIDGKNGGSPAALHLAMLGGHAGAVTAIGEAVERLADKGALTVEQMAHLFAAGDSDGNPAIHAARRLRRTEAADAWQAIVWRLEGKGHLPRGFLQDAPGLPSEDSHAAAERESAPAPGLLQRVSGVFGLAGHSVAERLRLWTSME